MSHQHYAFKLRRAAPQSSTTHQLASHAANREHPDSARRLAGLLADAAIRWPAPTVGEQRRTAADMRAAAAEIVADQPYLRDVYARLLDELEFVDHPGELAVVEEFADTGMDPFDSDPIRSVLLLLDQHVAVTDETEEMAR